MSNSKKSGKSNSKNVEPKASEVADDGASAPEAAEVATQDKRRDLLKKFAASASFDDGRSVVGEVRSVDKTVQTVSRSELSPLQVQGVELRRLTRHGGEEFMNGKGKTTWPSFPSVAGHQCVLTLDEARDKNDVLIGWKDGYGRVWKTPGTYLQVSRELYDDVDLAVGLKIEGLHTEWLKKWVQKPNNKGELVGGQKTVVLVGCTNPNCLVGSSHMQTLRRGRTMLRDGNNEPMMKEIQVRFTEYENPRTVKAPAFGHLEMAEEMTFGDIACNDFGDLIRAKKSALASGDHGLILAVTQAMDALDPGAPLAYLRSTSDLHNPAHPLNPVATNPGGENHAKLRFITLGKLDGKDVIQGVNQSLADWGAAEEAGKIVLDGDEFKLKYAGLDPETSKGIAYRPCVCPSCRDWAQGQVSSKKKSGSKAKAATSMKDWRAKFDDLL